MRGHSTLRGKKALVPQTPGEGREVLVTMKIFSQERFCSKDRNLFHSGEMW